MELVNIIRRRKDRYTLPTRYKVERIKGYGIKRGVQTVIYRAKNKGENSGGPRFKGYDS